MKSKIDYHILTMDEIVFDNRNKAYGAFQVRLLYESNLTKAMLLTASIFLISMSAPALLKGLGWLVEKPAKILHEEIFHVQKISGPSVLPPVKLNTNKPAHSTPQEKTEYQPVERKDLPKDPVTPLKDPVNQTSVTAGPVNPGDNGDPKGNGPGVNPAGNLPAASPVTVFTAKNVQQMPEFIGGQDAFQAYVDENIVYPADEKIDEVEGIARIEFIVSEDGSVGQVRVYRSSGNSNLDKEAVRLVKSLPKYKPGRHNGVPVKVLCILPIEFTIR